MLIRYPDESGVKPLEEVATGIGCKESLEYRRDHAAPAINLTFSDRNGAEPAVQANLHCFSSPCPNTPHRAGTASPLH